MHCKPHRPHIAAKYEIILNSIINGNQKESCFTSKTKWVLEQENIQTLVAICANINKEDISMNFPSGLM